MREASRTINKFLLRQADIIGLFFLMCEMSWQNRAHFFAVPAPLMSRILVDGAHGKRGGHMNRLRIMVGVFLLSVLSCQSGVGQSAPSKATSASPELVGQLTKELSITPAQAKGGAGALFGLAKDRLSPADFSKVAAAVPGMKSFLKAAPATDQASEFSGPLKFMRLCTAQR